MNRQRIIRVLRKLSAVVAVLPLIFSFILSYFQPTPRDNGESLQFDGEFVILAFSGLFLKEDTRFLEEKISEHRPDLVLLCGDNVFPQTLVSDLLFAGTMRIIDKYIGVFEKRKTYFSALFGTYDIAGLFDKSAQLKRFMRSDYFVGGVQDSQSVKVMSANKKSHGNFRISIIVEGETYYIFVVDSSGGELGADSKE
ncbi:MAG: hypothetical protein PHC84_05970, partial [Clostridia bacterium]|nr:hypothetical protein [Clostridia bacterium]